MTYSEGPRLNKENNPGRARWCDKHNRLECTKRRSKAKTQCHGPAVRGLDACKIHPGVSTAVARVKGEARITAWSAIGDAAQTVDYRMAVLGVLQMSWLRLAAYSKMLEAQMEEGRRREPVGYDHSSGDGETAGLIGYRYGAAGKDGNIYAQGEEIRALVILEAAERDRVVKYAKTAHDMGISDRLTSLAEKWGDVVASRISSMLDALELTPEQQERVPVLVQSYLGSIDMGATMADPGEQQR